MSDREAARELELAIQARGTGASTKDVLTARAAFGDLRVAEMLAGLRLAEESRIRESLRARLHQRLSRQREVSAAPAPRPRPWDFAVRCLPRRSRWWRR